MARENDIKTLKFKLKKSEFFPKTMFCKIV